ncbi:hypothetical protein SZ64_09970 [Erythrobacter sp. SG61-1L]|uniref:hypothetical protein n=1 Tax=Erythrobacter sp. SG61-1L TaxID=1603897 RepID=UPI0006C93355|nr:hypothetical protein [Erythrobacter sp. SG61-1L]KPL68416.1 hypothetical protein SZ64_09970 [Erythrobacter sp. SG61-1L]
MRAASARLCSALAVIVATGLAGPAIFAQNSGADQAKAPTSLPGDILSEHWVGRCVDIGTSTPAAKCAEIARVVPPQLEEMERIRQWMETYRSWPNPPLFKPDKVTGKLEVVYVDYEKSTKAEMQDTVGGYSRDQGRITFTQREVAAAYGLNAGEGAVAPLHTDWGALLQFSAHEMFHAYQAGSPFSRSYYFHSRSQNDKSVAWISEGTADAAGYLYQRHRFGSAGKQRATSYARPLNRTEDGGYDRGEFWMLLAQLHDSRDPIRFLFDLHKSTEVLPKEGYEESIAWLEGQLRAQGSSLREDYGRVIAQVVAEDRYWPTGSPSFNPPTFDANSADVASEVKSGPLGMQGLAAVPFRVRLKPDILKPGEDAALPGKELVWFEMLADAQSSPERVGLVAEAEWVDRKPFTRLIVPEGREVKFFARMTNVDGTAPEGTEPARARVNLISRKLLLVGPGCISIGRSAPVGMEIATNALGTMPQLELKAQRGSIADGVYTAPGSAGPETLSVRAWKGARAQQDVWVPFAKFDVRPKACSIVISYSDGQRLVYDAQADATRNEPGNNEHPSYSDRNGYVGFDEEEGRWVRVPIGAVLQTGVVSPLLFQWVPNQQQTATDHHRAPLAIIEMMKQMRSTAKKVKGLGTETTGACPGRVSAAKCIILTFEGEAGGNRYYYNKDGDPVAMDTDDGLVTIEYTDDVVRVPI